MIDDFIQGLSDPWKLASITYHGVHLVQMCYDKPAIQRLFLLSDIESWASSNTWELSIPRQEVPPAETVHIEYLNIGDFLEGQLW